MKIRFPIFFVAVTALFLFYPADTWYSHLFAYHRDLFIDKKTDALPPIHPVVSVIASEIAPTITAEGAYIIDLDSFTPVYEKNSKANFYPASTTKIITALVTMDLYQPNEIVTVKRTIDDGQVMGLLAGEKLTVENLLYGMLIHSGNDAAYAVADAYGYDTFIKKMNEKAKELHMDKSNFRNPAGLDDYQQITTPYDLALAARELLHNPYLKKIVSIKEIEISDVDFTHFYRLSNVNKLLGEIQGIGGVKTGYTPSAGENLVSFYRYSGHDFLIVILKSLDRFNDTKNIVGWIQTNTTYTTISGQ